MKCLLIIRNNKGSMLDAAEFHDQAWPGLSAIDAMISWRHENYPEVKDAACEIYIDDGECLAWSQCEWGFSELLSTGSAQLEI